MEILKNILKNRVCANKSQSTKSKILDSSSIVLWVDTILLRKRKWTENRRAYKILVTKPEGNQPFV